MAGFFGFFNYSKPGPGVPKDVQDAPFIVFFKVIGRKWTKFIQLNLLYTLTILPLILLLLLFAPIPTEADADSILLLYTYEIVGLMILSVVGIPIFSVGFCYILRNYSREEHAFLWSDFFDQVKLNFKRGLLLTAIDLIAAYLIVVSYNYYSAYGDGALMYDVCRWFIVVGASVYYFMHYYIYQLMVTFDMPFSVVIRNALMLVLAKLPFNLLVALLCAVIAALIFGFNFIVGIVVSALFGISLLGYIVNFYVNNVIYKLMILPNQSEQTDDTKSDFKDEFDT